MTDQNESERPVVGLGEILWDVFPSGRRLGGAPANFAYHAAQFGHRALVVSAVGFDRKGNDIISELARRSLPAHIDRVPFPTGTVKADISDADSPIYTIRTRCAWSHIPFTDELLEIASAARAVCFGTLAQWNRESRGTILRFLDACPGDCLKILDINLRQRYFTKATIRESLRRADILKLNEAELSVVTGLLGYKLAGEELLCSRLMRSYGLKMIILTKGTDGSVIVHGGGKSFRGAPKVKTVSTVGAGDAFTGAFIGSLLNGKSIGEAHGIAVNVAAYVCTRSGAMPKIPDQVKSGG